MIRLRRLSQAWLSVLIVAHLKTLDLTSCPDVVDENLIKTLLRRCQVYAVLILKIKIIIMSSLMSTFHICIAFGGAVDTILQKGL